jgi:hypothetical protein
MEQLVPLGAFAMIVLIIKFLSDNRLKRNMIEKNVPPETMQYLFSKPVGEYAPSSLKWGLVLTGIGLGAFVGLNFNEGRDEYTLACMLLFGGVALIVYYFIAARTANKN